MVGALERSGFSTESQWTHGRGMVLFHIGQKPA